jgi:hypothetical protein
MPDPVEGTTPEETTPANAAEVVQQDIAPATHRITVDGKDSEVSLEELKAMAQKGASADQRYRDAAALNKEAETAKVAAERHTGMLATIKQANTAGPAQADALRALARDYPEFGVSAEDAEIVITHIAEKEAEVAKPEERAAAQPPTFEELPERVQKTVTDQEASNRQTNLNAVRENLAAALDNDEVLATILIGKRKGSRSQRLTDHALSVLSRKVTEAGRYTPDAVRAAVEETRQFATDIGLLDVDTPPPGSPLGVPRARTTPFGKHRKPGEAPPRIAAKDALDSNAYADNVLERLEFAQMQNSE